MSHKQLEFKEALADTDYGLIVGSDGGLKGIWIPEGKLEDDIPDAIVLAGENTTPLHPHCHPRRLAKILLARW